MLVTALRESRPREWFFFFLFSVLVTATVRTSPIGEESSRADFLRPFHTHPDAKNCNICSSLRPFWSSRRALPSMVAWISVKAEESEQ